MRGGGDVSLVFISVLIRVTISPIYSEYNTWGVSSLEYIHNIYNIITLPLGYTILMLQTYNLQTVSLKTSPHKIQWDKN